MASRLADRLREARRRQFVGRAEELALFESALGAAEVPFSVLYIFGPGGVGKTTLLAEYIEICRRTQTPVILLDARNVEPAPDAFLDAFGRAMGLTSGESPLDVLASRSQRHVILIDTYETLALLDSWLRELFLPQLPEDTLTVLAGREPPPIGWRIDPGWAPLVRTLSLRNLSPVESRGYLHGRAVPEEQHQRVLDFTHGHPLALSLVADLFAQRNEMSFEPASPDVIRILLERLVQKVPGPAHRAALEVCALVRVTTEALLADILGMPDVHDLFDWLRALSFVEAGPQGLFPHDLARDALMADLRWRNPDWFAELHRRAGAYYRKRLQQTRDEEQQRVLIDYIYLHRDSAVLRPFFEWKGTGGALAGTMRDGDRPALLQMIARHEGEESARLAAHWLDRQPEGVVVFRGGVAGLEPISRPSGVLVTVALQRAAPEDLQADPATRAAWHYLQRHAPLRPGEAASLFRFWMVDESYQGVSPIQSLIFVTMVRHYLTTPGLAFTFLPCAEPDFWAPVFAYGEIPRVPEADFEVGGRRYGVYGHDWRVMPPMNWLALMAEREVATPSLAAPPAASVEPLVVLSRTDFADAVRDVLRNLFHPEALRGNPLLRSRMIVERAGAETPTAERVARLLTLVRDAVGSLQHTPAEAKLYRALYHTYLHPAPTQEQAAELLDLPFSTYRRHLKAGIAHVVNNLWHQEIGGLEE